jgi:hypothetical protein
VFQTAPCETKARSQAVLHRSSLTAARGSESSRRAAAPAPHKCPRPGTALSHPAKDCGCDGCKPERQSRRPGHELARVLDARGVANIAPARAQAPACGVGAGEMGDEALMAVLSATEEQMVSDTEVETASAPAKSCGCGAPAQATDSDTSTEPEAPHAGSATIVCDGSDGYKVDLGSWAGAPCGTEGCVRKHEEQHAADWRGRWPEGCKGKAVGATIPLGGAGYAEFLKKSECSAHTVDLACAETLLAAATGDCKAKVKAYADLTRTQKAGFC